MIIRCPNLRTDALKCQPDCPCGGKGTLHTVTAMEVAAEFHRLRLPWTANRVLEVAKELAHREEAVYESICANINRPKTEPGRRAGPEVPEVMVPGDGAGCGGAVGPTGSSTRNMQAAPGGDGGTSGSSS